MMSSVKIGPYKYKVKFLSSSVAGVLEAEGALDTDEKVIYLRKSLGGMALAEAFLHEIYHGMYFDLGLSKGMDEESLVTLLGRGHMEFIKDNPKTLEWITNLIEEDS